MKRLAVVLGAIACAVCAVSARADTGVSFHDRLVSDVQQGLVAANQRWAWKGWYQDIQGVPGWSSIWDTEQLFQAYVGLNQASPSLRNRDRVLWFAAKSEEGFYNASLGQGIGGFATGYDDKGVQNNQWFDDNGWLGLSFMDAWRATKQKRFLKDAEIAFRYLYQAGWDPIGGGIWWNTQHSVKAAESVNTAALLAVELYEAHAGAGYLTSAQRLISWADDNLLDQDSGLYMNHPQNGVTVSYLESPMLDAFVRLCRDVQQYCGRVKPFTSAILTRFGGDLDQPPQFDAAYVRYLMDVYELTQDQRLYAVAVRNAQRIERNAVDVDGYYLKAWDGSMSGVRAGLVSVHGAALEVLAWTAAETS